MQRVANTPVVRRAASRVANTPVVRRAVGWVSSTPLVREARNAYHAVATWVSNSPERAVAVGNGLLNAGTDFVGQVIDDGLANVDLGRVAVSFGEGYLTGMVAAYAPRATTVLGRDQSWARVITMGSNAIIYTFAEAITGRSDSEQDFWTGLLFAMYTGRSGGLGGHSWNNRLGTDNVWEMIRGSGIDTAIEEGLTRLLNWILGDDYEYEYN